MPTKIQWAGETKNPVKIKVNGEMKGYHCTKVSEGCLHCYGERLNLKAGFFPWANGIPYDDREVEFVLDQKFLDDVMRYRKPRRIFWQSMGDLFHEGIPDEFIDCVFAVAALTLQHQHVILTKRPERMREYLSASYGEFCQRLNEASRLIHGMDTAPVIMPTQKHGMVPSKPWPLPNVWLGVTAENRSRFLERVGILREIPAAVHFVSGEPLLGDLGELDLADIEWFIVGGETGPGARPVHPDWVYDIRDQCQAAGVPFFFKQWGEWLADEFELAGEGPRSRPEPYHWFSPLRHKGESIGTCCFRIGKKLAGRELDDREWNEYPK